MIDLDIVIAAPGMPFQGDTLEHRALGGSETAALCMAQELSLLGHHVTVFSNCEKPGMYGKVAYLSMADARAYMTMVPHDVCIVERDTAGFTLHTSARLNILWCHDMALLRQAAQLRGTMWNIDRVFVLSQFMRDNYKKVYELPDDLVHLTRNGVELGLVAKSRSEVRSERNG